MQHHPSHNQSQLWFSEPEDCSTACTDNRTAPYPECIVLKHCERGRNYFCILSCQDFHYNVYLLSKMFLHLKLNYMPLFYKICCTLRQSGIQPVLPISGHHRFRLTDFTSLNESEWDGSWVGKSQSYNIHSCSRNTKWGVSPYHSL